MITGILYYITFTPNPTPLINIPPSETLYNKCYDYKYLTQLAIQSCRGA